MASTVNTLKNYAPLIFIGGGIGMLSNTLSFEILKYLAKDDKATSNEKFKDLISYGSKIGLIATIASNALLFSARLIMSLSLKDKQCAFLNLASRNISNWVIAANVICTYVSIVIKTGSIFSRIIASEFFVEEEKKEWSAIAFESIIGVGAFVLSGALGAAGTFLIQKYFPES